MSTMLTNEQPLKNFKILKFCSNFEKNFKKKFLRVEIFIFNI